MNVAVSNAGRRRLWVTFWVLVVFLYAPIVILDDLLVQRPRARLLPVGRLHLALVPDFVENTEILDALRMSL